MKLLLLEILKPNRNWIKSEFVGKLLNVVPLCESFGKRRGCTSIKAGLFFDAIKQPFRDENRRKKITKKKKKKLIESDDTLEKNKVIIISG